MCVRVYVVYEDTNLYNDMGMTSGVVVPGEVGILLIYAPKFFFKGVVDCFFF